jgi:hypothetical protein
MLAPNALGVVRARQEVSFENSLKIVFETVVRKVRCTGQASLAVELDEATGGGTGTQKARGSRRTSRPTETLSLLQLK